jgi:hypothetical protein
LPPTSPRAKIDKSFSKPAREPSRRSRLMSCGERAGQGTGRDQGYDIPSPLMRHCHYTVTSLTSPCIKNLNGLVISIIYHSAASRDVCDDIKSNPPIENGESPVLTSRESRSGKGHLAPDSWHSVEPAEPRSWAKPTKRALHSLHGTWNV